MALGPLCPSPCPAPLTLTSKGAADVDTPWEVPTSSLFNVTAEHTADGDHRCSCFEGLSNIPHQWKVRGYGKPWLAEYGLRADGQGLTEAPSPCLCDPEQTATSLKCILGTLGTTTPA